MEQQFDFICKCNNCDALMIDRNPDWYPTQTVPDGVQEMVMLGEPLDGMILLAEEAQTYCEVNELIEPNLFWACPKCLTDDYLTDYVPEEVKDLFDEYEENRGLTSNALLFKERLESVGYTIEVDLDLGGISNLKRLTHEELSPELNPNFWDCECEHDYIKPKSIKTCDKCGAIEEEQPDSRQSEINKL